MIIAATALTMALSLMIATMISIYNQSAGDRRQERHIYSDVRR